MNNNNIINKYTKQKLVSTPYKSTLPSSTTPSTNVYMDDGLGNRIPSVSEAKAYINSNNTLGGNSNTLGGNSNTLGGNSNTLGGNTTPQNPQYSTGYDDLINSFNNSGKKVSLPNYGVFNPYMSVGNTNLSYYKNLASSIESNLNSLFTAKYGAGNYNMNNGWYQGDAIEDWDKNAENQGFAQYQKLITDLYNVNNMIAKYQSIEQDRQQQTARLGIQQELIEKYLQEDRRLRGIENSGQAETSTNAILNAYINAGNQLRQNAQNNLYEQEMNFQNAQYESMNNFNNQLQTLQENEEETRTSDLKELISYASTLDDFELLEENFGDEISNNKVLQYLFENSKANAKKYAEEEANNEALGKYLTNYGTSADQGISAEDLSPSMFNWNGSGKGKDQDKAISYIKDEALSGRISNGTIIDMNYGDGTNLYLYYNGTFYPVDSGKYSATYGYTADEIYKNIVEKIKNSNLSGNKV